MEKVAIDIIREELEKRDIKVVKIILFGSRARGDFTSGSDWDIFVIIDKDLSFKQKQDILTEIYRRLAKLEGSYEVILQSHSKFEKTKNIMGYISYDVDKEGVVIWTS